MTADAQTDRARCAIPKRRRRKRQLLPYVADSILLEETGMPWLVRSSIFAAWLDRPGLRGLERDRRELPKCRWQTAR